MPGPLTGVRVVDFTRVLAGPHCTKTLRDLGADVIKVEPPRPDVVRFAVPRRRGLSHYFAQQNSGKRCISLDLNVPEAREVASRLCASADVIVENFRPGTLASFGLGYADIVRCNPRVIYASISGYGQAGPWAHRSAYAVSIHAETGITAALHRHLGCDLAVARNDAFSHADLYTALQATVAILAALHQRRETGTGQHVDIAMAATMLAVNERLHADLSGIDLGAEPAALGIAQSPFFVGADGRLLTISASPVGSLTFPLFARVMRQPWLAADPRFATPEARTAHLEELHTIVQCWVLTFPTFEGLQAQLDEVKLAAGVVRNVQELMQTEWAAHWGAVETVSDRHGGTVRIPGHPWRFSASTLASPGEPAYQGEHNREVLAELGYRDEEIDALVRAGALRSELADTATPASKGERAC